MIEHETEECMSSTKYVIEFDYRSDDGPRLVGTFQSRADAERWMDAQKIATAEWSIVALWQPERVR